MSSKSTVAFSLLFTSVFTKAIIFPLNKKGKVKASTNSTNKEIPEYFRIFLSICNLFV
jgi:hypothetical protein